MNELHKVFIQAVAADFNVSEDELLTGLDLVEKDFDYQKRLDQAQTRIRTVESDAERLFWVSQAILNLRKNAKKK
jgi:hypothetical protein